MRVSELSRQSGVTIPTIKFYLREGLLQPGEATAATRAEYGGPHLRRLRLIRALVEIGELPVAAIKRIVDGLDDETVSLHELLGRVQYALGPRVSPPDSDPDWERADREVAALIDELGWQVEPRSPARALLSGALMALHKLDVAPQGPSLRTYAEGLAQLAALEVASVGGNPAGPVAGGESSIDGNLDEAPAGGQAGAGGNPAGPAAVEQDRAAVVESAVAGMVLYERVLIALRRLAQEDASAARFGPGS